MRRCQSRLPSGSLPNLRIAPHEGGQRDNEQAYPMRIYPFLA